MRSNTGAANSQRGVGGKLRAVFFWQALDVLEATYNLCPRGRENPEVELFPFSALAGSCCAGTWGRAARSAVSADLGDPDKRHKPRLTRHPHRYSNRLRPPAASPSQKRSCHSFGCCARSFRMRLAVCGSCGLAVLMLQATAGPDERSFVWRICFPGQ